VAWVLLGFSQETVLGDDEGVDAVIGFKGTAICVEADLESSGFCNCEVFWAIEVDGAMMLS
jgi:hypothetical protein